MTITWTKEKALMNFMFEYSSNLTNDISKNRELWDDYKAHLLRINWITKKQFLNWCYPNTKYFRIKD